MEVEHLWPAIIVLVFRTTCRLQGSGDRVPAVLGLDNGFIAGLSCGDWLATGTLATAIMQDDD